MSDISIQVAVPDGLPVPRASLWIEPETTEQFEAYLDALGGITKARVSEYFNGYIAVDIDGATAVLYFPPTVVPEPHALLVASLQQRQERARDLMARLEASGESTPS